MIGFIVGLALFVLMAIDMTAHEAAWWQWIASFIIAYVVGAIVNFAIVVVWMAVAWVAMGIRRIAGREE